MEQDVRVEERDGNGANNMNDAQIRYKDGGIRQYDGYLGDPIWIQTENDSTYYNSEVDSQCRVPSKSLEELKEELGLVNGRR